MALAAGARLGPYEIVAPLGAGGMGEVYRARDLRLRREVAIKILRDEAIRSQEGRRRLETEARAASSLNHPNILTIHDIGDESGAPYVVSELVSGESLRAALREGNVPVRKLLDIAVQIADGLAAAHEAGIAHRDLKPENIMITPEGRVKIVDFGLARPALVAAQGEDAETVSELLTSPGMIVGTLAYMSPEQACGRKVDHRSDQFSFGCVLYEMSTGHRAFRGKDAIEILSAVVRDEPAPIATLNPAVPAPLRWIIGRCLAKEAAQRYVSTADLHSQLRDLRDHAPEIVSSESVAVPVPAPARRRLLLTVLLIPAFLVAGFLVGAGFVASRKSDALDRFTPFAAEAVDETAPVWSPDGQTLAYTAQVNGIGQVFTRNLTSAVPAQITHSPSSCSRPFWSPDGTRIFYSSQESLWSTGAAGGTPQLVLNDVQLPAISPDGMSLAFFRFEGDRTRLWTSSASDADVRPYRQEPFPEIFRYGQGLQFSPDGRKLIVNLEEQIDREGGSFLWIVPHPTGKPRRLPARLPTNTRQTGFSWMPDSRRVVFAAEIGEGSGSHIYSLDTESGVVRAMTATASEEQDPSVSPDGTRIVFASGSLDRDLVEGSVDRRATSDLLATARQEHSVAWAPSGNQYAYVSDARGTPEIWLRSVAEGWARPVVTGHAEGFLTKSKPCFSRDGQRIAYVRMAMKHLVWVSHISGGREVPLESESTDQHGCAWSPDGQWIAYTRFVGGKWEIAKAPSGGSGRPIRLVEGGSSETTIDWSASRDWIAFGDFAGLHLVSPDGKAGRVVLKVQPAAFGFSRDGSKIYVIRRRPDRSWELAAISVSNGAETKAELDLPLGAEIDGFSLHPDGTRFATSVGTARRDIWILEGFERPAGWFGWLALRRD